MFENLLTKLVEKVAQEIGGKAASLILDEKACGKRTSFDLYHSLRTLEETLTRSGRRPFAIHWAGQEFKEGTV